VADINTTVAKPLCAKPLLPVEIVPANRKVSPAPSVIIKEDPVLLYRLTTSLAENIPEGTVTPPVSVTNAPRSPITNVPPAEEVEGEVSDRSLSTNAVEAIVPSLSFSAAVGVLVAPVKVVELAIEIESKLTLAPVSILCGSDNVIDPLPLVTTT
jgi:hypothetical protein